MDADRLRYVVIIILARGMVRLLDKISCKNNCGRGSESTLSEKGGNNMKLLSVAVPCYNSENYMEHCIQTLLAGGTDVEILIIDDGSTDLTGKIADDLAAKHKDIVRVIHQENGGHGEAVNTGIRSATGIYFKVVDSDDWVDIASYKKILKVLKKLTEDCLTVDMLVSNFVYEKEGAKHKSAMRYQKVLPENRVFTWKETGHFRIGQYLLMHSIIYRTEILQNSGLKLPAHTFYVDNLFAYLPLKYVKKIYYVNVDFYRYYIGRQEQSVNENVMIRRIDQQIRVNQLMVSSLNINQIEEKKLREYLFHYLEIVTVISSIMLLRFGTEENLKKKKMLWKYIRDKDNLIYLKLKKGIFGIFLNMHGFFGRKLPVMIYQMARKVIGFN